MAPPRFDAGAEALLVEEALERYFPSPESAPEVLLKAMHYSLFAGGKRLRPILSLLGAESIRQPAETILPLASALEFVHTYSLIHDDLPALDDDDLRRGKPTCHLVFGEAMAIMAGDALLTEAFRLISAEQSCTPPERVALLIEALGEAAGLKGMIGGQVYDLTAGNHLNLSLLREIHLGKTARLIGFAVSAPAIVAGEHIETIAGLRSFGEHVGIAFQIVDDILDEIGTAESLGKTPGSDRRQEKVTYASLRGIGGARSDAEEEIARALASLGGASESREAGGGDPLFTGRLEDFAEYVLARDS